MIYFSLKPMFAFNLDLNRSLKVNVCINFGLKLSLKQTYVVPLILHIN